MGDVGALALGGALGTIAVIANGADIYYPPENAALQEKTKKLACSFVKICPVLSHRQHSFRGATASLLDLGAAL